MVGFLMFSREYRKRPGNGLKARYELCKAKQLQRTGEFMQVYPVNVILILNGLPLTFHRQRNTFTVLSGIDNASFKMNLTVTITSQNGQTHFKNLAAFAAGFLTCV